MGKTALVNQRIEEGRKLVDCLTREGRLQVLAAYWIYDMDDQEWSLHIASPTFDNSVRKHPYLPIIDTLREHPEIDLEDERIWPAPTDDRKVVEILDFLRNYPAAEAFQLRGVYHKGRWVETSCIYPIKLDDMMVAARSNGS
jgi:hypothetical protein